MKHKNQIKKRGTKNLLASSRDQKKRYVIHNEEGQFRDRHVFLNLLTEDTDRSNGTSRDLSVSFQKFKNFVIFLVKKGNYARTELHETRQDLRSCVVTISRYGIEHHALWRILLFLADGVY